MASIPPNGFGSATYGNRPTSRGRAKRSTRSLSPARRAISPVQRANSPTLQVNSPTLQAPAPQRPVSPYTASQTNGPTANLSVHGNQRGPQQVVGHPSNTAFLPALSSYAPHFPQAGSAHQTSHTNNLQDERDKKDDKAMLKLMKSILPQFSNEHDWEMASFELALVLDRIWPHKPDMNISEYLTAKYSSHDRDLERRADSLIYFALTLSAKKRLLRQTANHGCMSSGSHSLCPAQ
jgi:hypothetical protein